MFIEWSFEKKTFRVKLQHKRQRVVFEDGAMMELGSPKLQATFYYKKSKKFIEAKRCYILDYNKIKNIEGSMWIPSGWDDPKPLPGNGPIPQK